MIELERNGHQVGDNDDAVDVVLYDEDGEEFSDTLAIACTMKLAVDIQTLLEPEKGATRTLVARGWMAWPTSN